MAAYIALAIIITLVFSTSPSSIFASFNGGGFSVELISRDSPISPFYNPQETQAQRLVNAFRRSMSRVHHFGLSKSLITPEDAQSDLFANNGEYLMEISLGTPAFSTLAIADTGSDLIWTQCKPCTGCYKQDLPLFDPAESSTYRDLSCSTTQCENLSGSCSSGGVCSYSYSYGDRSFTKGNLAADTVTLGSTNGRPVSIPKAVVGCGHNNDGTFSSKGSGIVGLGGGSISLISQLGSSIGGKFSYCLVPLSAAARNSSKLNFGNNGIVSGPGVQSTPLVSKEPNTFYFLTLEAISVGNQRIEFSDSSSSGSSEGNIIIDSGTTLTLVPADFFTELSDAVDKAVTGQRTQDPSGTLKLCYGSEGLQVPVITAHFTGADVELNPLNTFIQVAEGVTCFTFNPIESGAIFGNLAQMNFLVGYDLEKGTVSFKPTDCTKD